jgi:DNA-binding MarR family transcriptional regulator
LFRQALFCKLRTLKELAARGYIQRAESERDSRAKWVGLTPSGKKLISRLAPIVEQVDAEFFGALEPQGQKTIVQLLNQLVVKANQ